MRALTVTGSVWKYESSAAWYFLATTKEDAAFIRENEQRRIAWGSVPVRATLGTSTWETSVFPSKEGVYLLPLKAAIRKKEDIEEGMTISAHLEMA